MGVMPAARDNDAVGAGKRVRIVLIYALLGPPLGALFLILAGAGSAAVNEFSKGDASSLGVSELFQFLVQLLAVFPMAAVFSYFAGGVQASVTGIILAVISGPQGTFRYATAAIVAGLVCLVHGALRIGIEELNEPMGMAVLLIGIVTSLALRFLFRGLFAPRRVA